MYSHFLIDRKQMSLLFIYLCFIEVESITILLVSSVQQRDLVYMYVYIFFFSISFHYSLLQDIECSSPCYTVNPCWISILYMIVCIHWSHTLNLSFPFGSHKFVSYVFFFFFFLLFMSAPSAYGGSQARGLIRATAAGLRHSHSSTGSEPRLWPPPQLMATPDP